VIVIITIMCLATMRKDVQSLSPQFSCKTNDKLQGCRASHVVFQCTFAPETGRFLFQRLVCCTRNQPGFHADLPAEPGSHSKRKAERQPSLSKVLPKPRSEIADICSLAIPALGSVLADPLMSLVDTSCVGQVSMLELASLGPNTAIFNFVFQVRRTLPSSRFWSRRKACHVLLEEGLQSGKVVQDSFRDCNGNVQEPCLPGVHFRPRKVHVARARPPGARGQLLFIAVVVRAARGRSLPSWGSRRPTSWPPTRCTLRGSVRMKGADDSPYPRRCWATP
jgi:hypothetical protein